MNETMLDLLKDWNLLEPTMCRPAGEIFYVLIAPNDPRFVSQKMETVDLMHIQYAVQQAIVARGGIMSIDNAGGLWTAAISIAEHAIDEGDSVVEALLRAYLEVLKKERDNGSRPAN